MKSIAVLLLLLGVVGSEAFLVPHSCTIRNKDTMSLGAAGKGFKLRYEGDESGSSLSPGDRQKYWEQDYKDYIRRNGAQLCALSWRGFEAKGRGAVFAKYDYSSGTSEADKYGSNPSIYVELAQWEESGSQAKLGEKEDLRHILQRCYSYNPEESFVCVFQAHGLMGADTVKTSVSPREMAARLLAEEQQEEKRRQQSSAGQVVDVDSKNVEE